MKKKESLFYVLTVVVSSAYLTKKAENIMYWLVGWVDGFDSRRQDKPIGVPRETFLKGYFLHFEGGRVHQ